MLVAFITNTLVLSGAGAPWWNYPGFELWKFLNLFVFAGILFYLLRPVVGKAFKERRESIQTQLRRAQTERDAALAKLQEVEQRLTRLDSEVETVRANAEREAVAEAARMKQAAAEEIVKLRAQAQREIEGAAKLARLELREFTAAQSVKLAEEMLRREIRPEDDVRLVQTQTAQLGGKR